MKFSEISADLWAEQRAYFDTCILPLSGLDGSEQPHEATKKLADLQKTLDIIDRLYRGRIVIYPACHYLSSMHLDGTIQGLRSQFKYIFGATSSIMPILQIDTLDGIVQTTDEVRIKSLVEQLWQLNSQI